MTDTDTKSVEVVNDLAGTFRSLKQHPFWLSRYEYAIINGLLWGSEGGESNEDIERVFDQYHEDALECKNFETDFVFGIESNKHSDGEIECSLYTKSYKQPASIKPKEVAESFHFEWIEF